MVPSCLPSLTQPTQGQVLNLQHVSFCITGAFNHSRWWLCCYPARNPYDERLQTWEYCGILWQLSQVWRFIQAVFYQACSPGNSKFHPSSTYALKALVIIHALYDSRTNKLWICMEFCGGGSLQDIYHSECVPWSGFFPWNSQCMWFPLPLAVTGPLEEPQIAYICRETLQGLNYLHSWGKMHRDIKGANILLTDDGGVKLGGYHYDDIAALIDWVSHLCFSF